MDEIVSKFLTIEQIENEIDTSFSSSELLSVGYTQAVWTLLSVNEDAYLKYLSQVSAEQLDVFTDNRMNDLTYPLRACLAKSQDSRAPLNRALIDHHYQLALDWIEAAEGYSQFSTIFPLWHRKRVSIEHSGKGKLVVADLANTDKSYEAYNRLIGKEARDTPPSAEAADGLIDAILAQTRVKSDSFKINFTPQLVARLLAYVRPPLGARHTLPDKWKFNSFSLKEYREITLTLQAMSLAWHTMRMLLASNGMKALGYKSSVWVVKTLDLRTDLARFTGINPRTISSVLDLVTFGSNQIRSPDIATQPLVDLKNGRFAIAPFIWLNLNVERNLCALLNQIPSEKALYSRLVNEKEKAVREEIVSALGELKFDFASGNVDGTDLDLAIIDRSNKVCLCLELKWFIEPAEVREIEDRTRELAYGVSQAKKINALFEAGDNRLTKGLLNIDSGYKFFSAVASMNWIGFSDVQDPDIPIIKVWHLLRQIKNSGSLQAAISWLRNRDYLLSEGKDYEVASWPIKCGKWSADWYGIKPLP